jgi:hypothetical protein
MPDKIIELTPVKPISIAVAHRGIHLYSGSQVVLGNRIDWQSFALLINSNVLVSKVHESLMTKPSLGHNCVPKCNLGTRLKAELCSQAGSQAGAWEPEEKMVRRTHPTTGH